MEQPIPLESLPPRDLRCRSHYKIYLMILLFVAVSIIAYWTWRINASSWVYVYEEAEFEIHLSLAYFFFFECFYLSWLQDKLNRSVQVFSTHIAITKGKEVETLHFSEIESYKIVCWSIFYFKTKDGEKFYFNSSLERIDYIWEGFRNARLDLVDSDRYEAFRLKLVQYDHHEKRKEWFFRHKLVDVFNWIVLPAAFMFFAYAIQSKQVLIYQEGLYFFRLFMYSVLVLLFTTFFYSLLLKKIIFDRKLENQMEENGAKIRDMEFEGVILQRSKVFQIITACFLFSLIIRTDLNLYSVTKIKEDIHPFLLKKGNTIVVDNRYNCVECAYEVKDGDVILFGRGLIGQVMAKEGEMVGEVSQDHTGRTIASENVQEVPDGHIAVKASNGKDIMFVKIGDLIGKVQK